MYIPKFNFPISYIDEKKNSIWVRSPVGSEGAHDLGYLRIFLYFGKIYVYKFHFLTVGVEIPEVLILIDIWTHYYSNSVTTVITFCSLLL